MTVELSREERDGTNLGRTQTLVLRLLAAGGHAKSARQLAYDWPSLTESAARSAIARLGDRGLVDVDGWDSHDARTFELTARGAQVEARLGSAPVSEETP